MTEEDGNSLDFDDETRQVWLDTLPEPVRAWQEAATAKNPDSFWKSVSDTRSAVANSLRFPTEDASPEAVAEFYLKAAERSNGRLMPIPGVDDGPEAQSAYRKALGVPEEVTEYEFPVIEGLPPEMLPEDRANALRQIAHEAGIPARQFKEVAGKLLELDHQALQAARDAQKAQQGVLREEWGDAYDQRYERVAAFLERDGAPEALLQAAQGKNLGPDTARYFYGLLERMGSESASIARQTGGADVDTRVDIEQRIADITGQDGQQGRPLGPYWDNRHPAHQETIQRVMKLRTQLDPSLKRPIGTSWIGAEG